MRLAALFACFLAWCAPLSTLAQVAEAPAGDTDRIDDLGVIDINARSNRQFARNFVAELAAPAPTKPLARWDRKVCVGVANLAPSYAEYVIDRVSAVAMDLGLEVGEPGCKANIMIAFAADASDLARALVADDPRGFTPPLDHSVLGAEALRAFEQEERPVRWWHVSAEVDAQTGFPPVEVTFFSPPPESEPIIAKILEVGQMSFLRGGTRQDLQRAIIIVDVTRLNGAKMSSVADYVSMVAMAQINPEVDVPGQPSILALFTDQPTSDRLTDWDRRYLHSLYNAARNRPRAGLQRAEIVQSMVRAAEERAIAP